MGGIAKVGIPTKNRTASLNRCLRGFLDHVRYTGRNVEILVVDNASSARQATETQHLVSTLAKEYRASLRCIDRQMRMKWADQIARKLGISKKITRFALLGDDRCSDSYGACRNTLLLDAVGQKAIQTDDDTVCRVGFPAHHEDGIAISLRTDPNNYQYYSSRENALRSIEYEAVDLFSLHETFLGKEPVDLLASSLQKGTEPDISQSGSDLIHQLNQPGARVLSTFLGIVGDAGTQNHSGRLFQESLFLQPFMEDEENWHMALTARWTRKNVFRNTLTNASACMTIHIGLDLQKLVPPFMPVLRNEDGVFGSMCYMCFPFSFSVYLPYVIQHDPLEKRKSRALDEVLNPPAIRMNDLISQVILFAPEYCQSLRGMSNYLKEISGLPLVEFELFLLRRVDRTRQNIIAHSQHLLKVYANASERWKDSLRQHMRRQKDLIGNPIALLPGDLSGTKDERLKLLRQMIQQYGLLLRYWEAIFEAGNQTSPV